MISSKDRDKLIKASRQKKLIKKANKSHTDVANDSLIQKRMEGYSTQIQ